MNLSPTQDSAEGGSPPPDHPLFLPRRRFLSRALGLGAGAAGLAATGPIARAQVGVVAVTDPAILLFALNFDYLAAEYFTLGVTGNSIEALGIATTGMNTGAGNPGPLTVKPSPMVPFATESIRQMAVDLAVQEQRHVVFLRSTLAAFGYQPAARPAIDLLNSFNALAVLAGLGTSFDPFANEANFLLGGYTLEDVALTALHGAAPLIKNKGILNAAAGLLGIEGYHSSVIRTNLFQLGQGPATDLISIARTKLGGSVDYGVDNGPLAMGPKGTASIALADSNAIAPSRTFRQVLNIVYGAVNAPNGGFFPRGLNGPIR